MQAAPPPGAGASEAAASVGEGGGGAATAGEQRLRTRAEQRSGQAGGRGHVRTGREADGERARRRRRRKQKGEEMDRGKGGNRFSSPTVSRASFHRLCASPVSALPFIVAAPHRTWPNPDQIHSSRKEGCHDHPTWRRRSIGIIEKGAPASRQWRSMAVCAIF
uniref:Uncharacterized protein n=1 Tax=Oryza nivara TaxID=4536 RepID=A0A0E0FZ77_ORYNI